MADSAMQYWSIWYPKAGATGVHVGRCRIDPTDELLMHAAPEVMTVEVYDDGHAPLAQGEDLEATQNSPMCILRRDGDSISREDIWPTDEHVGLPVLLPGGEAGLLKSWWHADDQKEWRWTVEFYNSIRE